MELAHTYTQQHTNSLTHTVNYENSDLGTGSVTACMPISYLKWPGQLLTWLSLSLSLSLFLSLSQHPQGEVNSQTISISSNPTHSFLKARYTMKEKETYHQMSHQLRFKPLCPKSPVQTHVFDEERCNILPATIAHPAGLLQLSHVSIYKWYSSSALCGVKERWAWCPNLSFHYQTQTTFNHKIL